MPQNSDHTVTRYQWIVIAVCLACLFTSLGASRFWDQDEGFFAGTAASMYAQSDWIVPSFNGEMFGHKPPWMYWMMMTGYSLFGVGEFGARFFSAIFGMATALLVFRMGTRMFNPRVGLIAGLTLPTCLMFSVVSRAATPDVFLVFFSTLALYLFSKDGFLVDADDPAKPRSANRLCPPKWQTWLAMYALMGLAALVKGPIGFLFPMAVIGLFLLILTPSSTTPAAANGVSNVLAFARRFSPFNFCKALWKMRPLTAIAAIGIIAGPWYVAVGLRTDGAFLTEFFGVHHWQRFTTPMDNHSGPIFYYPLAILIGMFPWSIFAGPTVLEWFKQIRSRNKNFTTLVFLSCWIGVYVGLFSLASTKLPNYILPAYPALALMIAIFVDSALTRKDSSAYKAATWSFGSLVLFGGLLVATLPLVAWVPFNGQTIMEMANLVESTEGLFGRLAWIGLPLLLGGLGALWFTRTGHLRQAFYSMSSAAVLFILVFWNDSVPYADQFQTPQQIATRFQTLAQDHPDARLGQFGLFRPSMVYYGGGRLYGIANEDRLLKFLRSSEHESFAITTDEIYKKNLHLHQQLEVVAREPNFPKQGELLLLKERVQTAAKATDLR